MPRSSRQRVSVAAWSLAVVFLAVAFAAVLDACGQDDAEADEPPASLESLTKISGVTAALPTEVQGRPQVILLIGPASADGAPFERRIGTAEALPRLAAELSAAVLFAAPPAAEGDGLPDVKALQMALRKAIVPRGAARFTFTVVGHTDGAAAALALYARDASLVDTLVLVDPAAISDGAAKDLGRSPNDTRPCIVLATEASAAGAASAKAALKGRCEKADILEGTLSDADAVPMVHLANVLRWSTPAAVIDRGKKSVSSSAVPSSGPRRIETLTELIELQAACTQVAAAMESPVTLNEAAGAPQVDKDDALFKALAERVKALGQTAEDLKAKADRKFEAARAAAEKRAAALAAAMRNAPEAKQEALRKQFLEENFPWPDLVPEAVAAVTQEQFMEVISAKCTRCHRKAAGSMEDLLRTRWVRPGAPEQSPAYTIIGKHKKAGATYHNVSDDQKRIIYEYIKSMPR